MDFVQKWSDVLKDYALRYGRKVKGWWLDGMYRHEFGCTEELMQTYYRAIKERNPDAIVAFNNGVKPYFYRHYPDEEFTSGEHGDLSMIPESRFYNGAQTHVLLPIGAESGGNGATWAGGIVTFDCKLNRDGSFDNEQVEALRYVGSRLK